MKILATTPFSSPIHCAPGDMLRVIWRNEQRTTMETKIEKAQVLDTAVLVEYEANEAKELGFREVLGVFAGEAINEDAR